MSINFSVFLILTFSIGALADDCDDAKTLADKMCDISKIDVVVIQKKFTEGTQNAIDGKKDDNRGGAKAVTDSGDRVVSAVMDLDTYSQNCHKEIVNCSKACGQDVPDEIPESFTLLCMSDERASNYNAVQQVGKQMCKTVAQHEGLMSQISVSGAAYPYCSSFMSTAEMDAIAKSNIPRPNDNCDEKDNNCSLLPDTPSALEADALAKAASASKKISLASVVSELGSSLDRVMEKASPKQNSELQKPEQWLGYSIQYGDSKIGVASTDLFLMMQDRFSKIQNEMEN